MTIRVRVKGVQVGCLDWCAVLFSCVLGRYHCRDYLPCSMALLKQEVGTDKDIAEFLTEVKGL